MQRFILSIIASIVFINNYGSETYVFSYSEEKLIDVIIDMLSNLSSDYKGNWLMTIEQCNDSKIWYISSENSADSINVNQLKTVRTFKSCSGETQSLFLFQDRNKDICSAKELLYLQAILVTPYPKSPYFELMYLNTGQFRFVDKEKLKEYSIQ